uniref:Crystallin beta-gamma domain containing 2 n=1 Tax=Podarcis muralis TaxID=64176 RepID=A0A670IQV6_PODMU|nr:beta/gamma crystallin domain-containing protein 2 [Podarcis muralis]
MAKKEGLKRRLSRFFSRSELSLKELQQRRENEDEGPRLAGVRDEGGRGKWRMRPRKKRTSEGASEEDVTSVQVKHVMEPPSCSRSQKPASKTQALSYSEPDLWRNGLLRKFGNLTWHKRQSSHFELSQHPGHLASNPWSMGRLQRPAVGSDMDMRSRADFYLAENQSEKQERPEPSSRLSETHSLGTSPEPSTSFDSLLCWGDGSSWEGSFSISNSSLCCPAAPEMKGEALKLPSVLEESSKAPKSASEWTESVFEGYLTMGMSHPVVTEQMENLSFSSGLGESVSEHVDGAEDAKSATASPPVDQPLEVADSASAIKISLGKNAPKIRYEIMITMTKEAERAEAEPTFSCGERSLPCHPSGEETLSLGVAELEKRKERRHQEPARPATQLSASEEFQNCRGLHGVGTCKVCGPILTLATGSPATLQWGSETSPGVGEADQSETDRLHSEDGVPAKETDIVAVGSPANSFSESRGLSVASESEGPQPTGPFDTGRGLLCTQYRMEEVAGGSRSAQSRSGGSTATASLRRKTTPSDLLKEETKPSFGKVSAVTQMLERGSTRTRGNSPSRVSVLLEAWEKGLVGTGTIGPSSSTGIRDSRSPVPTRRSFSAKDAPHPLFSENTRSSLSPTNARQPISPAGSRRPLFPADTRRPLSPADSQRPPFLAETRRSRSPAHTRLSSSPAETRNSFSSAETRRSRSPAHTRRSSSPAETRNSFSSSETRWSQSPADIKESPSLADTRNSFSSAETRRSRSPAHTRRSSSPAETRNSFSSPETRRSQSPADVKESPSLADSRNSFSSAETRRSRSPAHTRRSSSPAETRNSFSSPETWRSHSPADIKQSPTDTRNPLSSTETRRSHSPAPTRQSPSPAETRRSHSPVDIRRTPSPADTRHSFPSETRRSRSPAHTRRSPSPADALLSFSENRRSHSPADLRRSPLADTRLPFSPSQTRRSRSPADTRFSSPAETRRSLSPANSRTSCLMTDTQGSASSQPLPPPVESRYSSAAADDHRSSSTADTQCSSSLPVDRYSYSVADIRRLYSSADTKCPPSPANTRHPVSSAETKHPTSLADARYTSSSADTKQTLCSAENKLPTSPVDGKHTPCPSDAKCLSSSAEPKHSFSSAESKRSSSPAGSRSFSPTPDGKPSCSPSPRRDFTAHGPVFAQVYTPASKPKSLSGTETQDANSTIVAGSQAGNHCGSATNTPLASRFQRESLISSTDGSQEEPLPVIPISTGAMESQRESHVPNGASSSIITRSLTESAQPSAIILRSQTENYQSQVANTTSLGGSLGESYTPRTTSTKPPSGPCVLSPLPCVVSSSTVAKSQTQWYGPNGNSMVVFRSERQVIVPQAGTTTVYRAGQEIIMSSSGTGSASKALQGKSLVPSSISSLPPKENLQSQSDLPDDKSPQGSPASLPDNVCNCSIAGSEQESCMTQSRSAGVSDAQRQRCMLLPNPAFTSNRDATTLREGVAPLSTSERDCSPHAKPAFQRHSNLFTSSRSEREQSMPDPDGPVTNGSEQENNLSRAKKANTSASQGLRCSSDAAEETNMLRTSAESQESVTREQKSTVWNELKEEQGYPRKDSPVFALEPAIPLTETNSSHEPPSQEAGHSSRTAEEEPEEAVDMELFVDTLRNMEPPELHKPLKLLPRPPRPSTFAKHTSLPPIDEDHVAPKSKLPLPAAIGELFALTEERNSEGEKEMEEEEDEMEEIENPYLTKDEKSWENSQARESYPWENKTFKTEEEIGSFLGKLQEGAADAKAKAIAPKAIANQSNLIRANILKGLTLLSGFSDKKPVEDKPYSRLDNSLLYSRFISPEKSQQKVQERWKEGRDLPTLLAPAAQKVNRECQTSPNELLLKAPENLSSESLPSALQAEPAFGVPGADNSSQQVTLLSIETSSLPQSKAQQEEKKLPTKINVRPGKIILYSEAGFGGQKREIWGDITDATSWELSHTISIRVIRGGWVMYEKPRFHGRKCVLAEGDVEITNPWRMFHKEGAAAENAPFHIGSLKRVVRDYRIPEISLFSEENGEGRKQKFTDSAEDTRIHNEPLQAASIIVHSGLWLVYSKPFFDDDPYVLEPGGYPSLRAWGAKDPSICSMHPIKMGCPVVEKPGEPKALIYEMPHFLGHSWEVSRDIYNLKKPENNQDSKMSTAGSLKILGGCWIGYEKEGFRGHQYLLEEGEYNDWTQWGGYNEELVSLRLIRTDFLDPALVLFEAMDFEDGPSVELSEALPDVELASYGTTTQSIHVLSGVWVAYEDKNFSGEQYILEKGVYRNCEDWGASSCQISSVQPILQVGEHSLHFISQIQLFSDPDFLGNYVSFKEDQASLPENFIPRSCRVNGGSWILYDCPQFDGEQHILSEGEYPTLTSMGCLFTTSIRSLKKVPIFFSEPSIFLHGLECFEGKEIELNSEVRSLQAEGFNNHVLSVRVKGGIWVLCEHSDFRGRQWLLDCMEITNWLTYSGLQHIGSLYPIRQRRIYFQIKNEELKSFLSVPDDVEDMKAGRVLVSELNGKSSSIWYYEEGLMKNQVAPNMSLQVIGPAAKGSKVVLWSESRLPRQTWQIDSFGRICSQMFENKVLDVKGGRTYDRDHAILWDCSEERPTQIWDVQVL